jgi:dolichyl-phosphate beta-glucosyltransferase
MDSRGLDYEVIVVDDGSTDGTAGLAKTSGLSRVGRLTVLSNGKNMGKGFSVKRGVEKARGEYVLFSDADLSTPISEIEKLLAGLKGGADVAIGSRSAVDSQVVVRQPIFRQTMGKVFNFLVRFILGERISDTQCGFKAFRAHAAKSLFSEMSVAGFAFDAELLFLARKRGLKVIEAGVVWKNSPISKVSPISSSFSMLRDVLKVRIAHR